MIIGFISDAHGNLPVFVQCLSYLEARCEKITFLGDAFGYMPEGNEILDIIMNKSIDMLCGNHDAMVAGLLPIDEQKDTIYRLTPQIQHLTARQKDFLLSLPTEMIIEENGASLLLVHASPWEPLQEYVYENNVDERFDDLNYDFLLMGHTHRPFISKRNNITIINTGSCGMPRDIGNLACVTLFDSNSKELEQVRIRFDETEIITRYGEKIHPEVIKCLKRK